MSSHAFNFDGGEYLTAIGATWFVSYSYYNYVDSSHENWKRVSTFKNRQATYRNTKQYHIFWLQKVLEMNPDQLNKNTINLSADTIKQMAKEILAKQ